MLKTPTRNKHARHEDYDFSSDLAKIKEALTDATQNAKGKAGQYLIDSFDTAKERTADAEQGIANFVADKPFKTIGASLLVGLLIGYLIHK